MRMKEVETETERVEKELIEELREACNSGTQETIKEISSTLQLVRRKKDSFRTTTMSVKEVEAEMEDVDKQLVEELRRACISGTPARIEEISSTIELVRRSDDGKVSLNPTIYGFVQDGYMHTPEVAGLMLLGWTLSGNDSKSRVVMMDKILGEGLLCKEDIIFYEFPNACANHDIEAVKWMVWRFGITKEDILASGALAAAITQRSEECLRYFVESFQLSATDFLGDDAKHAMQLLRRNTNVKPGTFYYIERKVGIVLTKEEEEAASNTKFDVLKRSFPPWYFVAPNQESRPTIEERFESICRGDRCDEICFFWQQNHSSISVDRAMEIAFDTRASSAIFDAISTTSGATPPFDWAFRRGRTSDLKWIMERFRMTRNYIIERVRRYITDDVFDIVPLTPAAFDSLRLIIKKYRLECGADLMLHNSQITDDWTRNWMEVTFTGRKESSSSFLSTFTEHCREGRFDTARWMIDWCGGPSEYRDRLESLVAETLVSATAMNVNTYVRHIFLGTMKQGLQGMFEFECHAGNVQFAKWTACLCGGPEAFSKICSPLRTSLFNAFIGACANEKCLEVVRWILEEEAFGMNRFNGHIPEIGSCDILDLVYGKLGSNVKIGDDAFRAACSSCNVEVVKRMAELDTEDHRKYWGLGYMVKAVCSNRAATEDQRERVVHCIMDAFNVDEDDLLSVVLTILFDHNETAIAKSVIKRYRIAPNDDIVSRIRAEGKSDDWCDKWIKYGHLRSIEDVRVHFADMASLLEDAPPPPPPPTETEIDIEGVAWVMRWAKAPIVPVRLATLLCRSECYKKSFLNAVLDLCLTTDEDDKELMTPTDLFKGCCHVPNNPAVVKLHHIQLMLIDRFKLRADCMYLDEKECAFIFTNPWIAANWFNKTNLACISSPDVMEVNEIKSWAEHYQAVKDGVARACRDKDYDNIASLYRNLSYRHRDIAEALKNAHKNKNYEMVTRAFDEASIFSA